MNDPKTLTIYHAQTHQTWTVPYSGGVQSAERSCMVPHILGSHCVLHAAKSIGKIASVYEKLDHENNMLSMRAVGQTFNFTTGETTDVRLLTNEQLSTLRAMAADLMTVALRLANLHGFDLAEALCERVEEKNGQPLSPWGDGK